LAKVAGSSKSVKKTASRRKSMARKSSTSTRSRRRY
jgi:hypothetical protein